MKPIAKTQVNSFIPTIDRGGDILEHNDLGSTFYGLDSGLWSTSMVEQQIMYIPNMVADLKPNQAYAANQWGLPISTQRMLAPNQLANIPAPAQDVSDVVARFREQVTRLAGYIPGSG